MNYHDNCRPICWGLQRWEFFDIHGFRYSRIFLGILGILGNNSDPKLIMGVLGGGVGGGGSICVALAPGGILLWTDHLQHHLLTVLLPCSMMTGCISSTCPGPYLKTRSAALVLVCFDAQLSVSNPSRPHVWWPCKAISPPCFCKLTCLLICWSAGIWPEIDQRFPINLSSHLDGKLNEFVKKSPSNFSPTPKERYLLESNWTVAVRTLSMLSDFALKCLSPRAASGLFEKLDNIS